ncbi:WbqC family protein [Sphingobacterium sp. lm-10]|uniref:WbqC family protein n=1 Tax=Sphingobacterium sp. lm-10 TaxID=2944904 RepID=UPI0020227F18|nr:WbqC family protein [Sphingobacterium sp. lm-10]MCL7986798.1 WbqC family protein [Sphingobacterium sp. lm-10]
MTEQLLLPAFYLPNVSYFQAIYQHKGGICIEQYEHFPKQTYRTRTQIGTANGGLDLIVPVMHGKKVHVPVKDVRINYDHPWQRLHWLSIQTAYRSSAYFEYYEDDFTRFYQDKFEFLVDYHMEQLSLLLRLLKINRDLSLSESYVKEIDAPVDWRIAATPRKPSLMVDPKPYYQVFEEKTGFVSNLSIIDLLFNQGPQSRSFL